LQEKQRLFGFIGTEFFMWVLPSLLILPVGLLVIFAIVKEIHTFVLLLCVAVLIISMVCSLYSRYLSTHFSTIHMCYASEKPNFFKRNKDNLAILPPKALCNPCAEQDCHRILNPITHKKFQGIFVFW